MRSLLFSLLPSLLVASVQGQTIEILELPDPTGWNDPRVLGISTDGRFVLGYLEESIAPPGVVYRWDAAGRVEAMPYGSPDWAVARITDDGRILGTRVARAGLEAGEWSPDAFHAWPNASRLFDATPDGSATILRFSMEPWDVYAVRYADASIVELPPPVSSFRYADLSADARTIVGAREIWDAERQAWANECFAVRDGVYERVEGLSPSGRDRCLARSAPVIIGSVAGGSGGSRPARKVANGAPEVLADAGEVWSISDDGRTIFMIGRNSAGEDAYGLWTPEAGFRTLTELGFVYNTTRDFLNIRAFSGDGHTLAGTIWMDEGPVQFRDLPARFHLPDLCRLDYATDGTTDFFDLLAFTDCFTGDCPNYRSADFNFDGFVDWMDYADFVDTFEAGC